MGDAASSEPYYYSIESGVKDIMGNLGMIFAGDEKTGKSVDFVYNPKTFEVYHTPVANGKRPK